MIMMMGAVGVMVVAMPYMMVRGVFCVWERSQLKLSRRKTWILNN
jgi:hypothetical protein